METKCTSTEKKDAVALVKLIDKMECSICSLKFKDLDNYVILKCTHVFCYECCEKLFEQVVDGNAKVANCPDCRNAYLKDQILGHLIHLSSDRKELLEFWELTLRRNDQK